MHEEGRERKSEGEFRKGRSLKVKCPSAGAGDEIREGVNGGK